MRTIVVAVCLSLCVQGAIAAPGADFRFTGATLFQIAQTIATIGRFNVIVEPALADQSLSYTRTGVAPLSALEELATLAGAAVSKAPGVEPPLYVVSAKPLPRGLKGPEAKGVPTRLKFTAVELSRIARTLAVLGKFDLALAPGVEDTKVTMMLDGADCAQALFWLAAALGLEAVETGDGGKPFWTVRKPAPKR